MTVPERLTTTVSTKGPGHSAQGDSPGIALGGGDAARRGEHARGRAAETRASFRRDPSPKTCSDASRATARPSRWRRWRPGFWRKRSGVMRAVDTKCRRPISDRRRPGAGCQGEGRNRWRGMFSSARRSCSKSEWVLRSVYGLSRTEVAAALRAFAGLPGLSVESPAVLSEALDHAERGMDFADALHLGAAARCEALLTFDLRFIEQAGGSAGQGDGTLRFGGRSTARRSP